jgi:hypothetical protein
MTTEAWNRWNSQQDDINFKTNARTDELINQLGFYHQNTQNHFTQSEHYNQLVFKFN